MLLAILDGSHYKKIMKMTTMALLFKIWTKHHLVWIILQIEHIVSHIGWQPLPKAECYSKMVTKGSHPPELEFVFEGFEFSNSQ